MDSSNTETRRLSFGIFIPQAYAWPAMLSYVQQVEKLGFESLWIADHPSNPYYPETDWFECWSMLGALAARTSRVRLGTAVSHIVYRNPTILALAAQTVDHISNGRFELGLGVGSGGKYNYQMTGVHPRGKKERVERYMEAVKLIDRLLKGETVTDKGQYYWVEEGVLRPGSLQKPRLPLNLAAHGPRTLKFAAAYGDAWNCFYTGNDLSPEENTKIVTEWGKQLDGFALEAGREPAKIRRTFFAGYTSDKPFESAGALTDFIGRYDKAGIDEIIFGYAPNFPQGVEFKGRWITDPEMLERTAGEIKLDAP